MFPLCYSKFCVATNRFISSLHSVKFAPLHKLYKIMGLQACLPNLRALPKTYLADPGLKQNKTTGYSN